MQRFKLTTILILIALLALSVPGVLAQGGDGDDEFTYAGIDDAPDFPADADWINTSGPITMADLRGKIVLLDFWTYGCINCIHVIPDLKRLEEEFAQELVVIGVHSAKFDNEGDTSNIEQVVRRYEVEHPVLNDSAFETWRAYGVNAWPTFIVIDPFGKVVGYLSGEPLYDRIILVIETMAQEYGDAGMLSLDPLAQWQPELAMVEHDAPLRFPGKVLADTAGNRLFIADSNNNRVVVTALDTFEVLDVIGTGDIGQADGDFSSAQFFRPQGMTLVGNVLYVADTENHTIRVLDFDARTVTTVAGTGQQGFNREDSGPGTDMALNSPWDLVAHEGKLYIAMAGPHQLWVYDIASGEVGPYAGSGAEALTDGPLGDAAMNQPSGIDTDGTLLYFADPEASAVRTADLDPDGEVQTIVGTGLFDFGDQDGVGDDVLLQHVLGITVADDGLLYVADTYNNKIKRINPETRESTTFLGTGADGFADGAADEALFYEPGGLDFAGGKLYIADTNNHAIRVADVATGTVTTVEFPNVDVLLAVEESGFDAAFGDSPLMQEDAIALPLQMVAPGEGTILLDVHIPEGYKLNGQAPFTALWPDDAVVQIPVEARDYRQLSPELPVAIPATFVVGQTELSVNLTIYWCEGVNETLCFVDRSVLVVPLSVVDTADTDTVVFARELVPPVVQDTLN
ncbi:MAG: redoxin domain-containing protein [Anaerolineae bacterium]|nr:redoxin domain-containing protein [Anaerolineae bacterium]